MHVEKRVAPPIPVTPDLLKAVYTEAVNAPGMRAAPVLPGVLASDAPAISGDDLDTFPVYPDLAGAFTSSVEMPDPTVAHALAVASGYAYADGATQSMIMGRLGLERNHCLTVTQVVDAMFIDSSAHVVQSADGAVVVVAYRGAKPAQLLDWITDADVYASKVAFPFPGSDATYAMHSGCYRNVLSTRHEVVEALVRALQGHSVLDTGDSGVDDSGAPLPNSGLMPNPMKTLYITGHSLGGAMAAILTVMLAIEPEFAALRPALRGAYTFGQPMIGSPEFAAACRNDPFLRHNVVRYVYRRDPVPNLPPKETDPFEHFGQEFRYAGEYLWNDHSDHPAKQAGLLHGLVEAPLGFVSKEFRRLRGLPPHLTIADHGPTNYVSALTPPGIVNEFGDLYLAAGA